MATLGPRKGEGSEQLSEPGDRGSVGMAALKELCVSVTAPDDPQEGERQEVLWLHCPFSLQASVGAPTG